MTSFRTILALASHELPDAGIDCLLIGGFAVNYYGYTRNTLDVDFMIVGEELDAVRRVMTAAGFTSIIIEDNVALFNTPGSPIRVDFLRVSVDTMRNLLGNAIRAKVQGCELTLPSLKDLIAMKIFSLSSDLARRGSKDLPDIAYLTVLNDLDVEADIRPLCSRFGTDEIYLMIIKQVEALRTT